MEFTNTFDLGDVISFVSMLLVVLGGFFGFHQWKNSIKIKRAEYLEKLTEKIRTDKDIKEVVYVLDYNSHQWYTPVFHNGEFENKMDKAQSYFSYICYLYQTRLIARKEFEFFKYDIERILMKNQIQNYLYNLFHFASNFNVPIF